MNVKIRRDYTRVISNYFWIYLYRFLLTNDLTTITNSEIAGSNSFFMKKNKSLRFDYQYFINNLNLGRVFVINPNKNTKLDSLNNSFCLTG